MVVENIALKVIAGMFELPLPVYGLLGLWIFIRIVSDGMVKGALAMRPCDSNGVPRKAEDVTMDEGMEQLSKMAEENFGMLVANLEQLSHSLNMLSDYLIEISLAEVSTHLRVVKDDVKYDDSMPETFVEEVVEEIEEIQAMVEEAIETERKLNIKDWRSILKPNGERVLVRQRSITPGSEEVVVKPNGYIRTKWGKYKTDTPIKVGRRMVVIPSGHVRDEDYTYYQHMVADGIVFWHEKEELNLKRPIREKLLALIRKVERKREQLGLQVVPPHEKDRMNVKDSVTLDYDVHDQYELSQLQYNYI